MGQPSGARSGLPPAPVPLGLEPAAMVDVHEATRGLLRAEAPADVVVVVLALVESLGGRVAEAREAGPDALPMDLTFGIGEPLVPAAVPAGIARLNLETVLPTFLEDARRVVMSLRHAAQLGQEADRDRTPGSLARVTLDRKLARLRPGDAVAIARFDLLRPLSDDAGRAICDCVLAGFGELVRDHVRSDDVIGCVGGQVVVALLGVPPAVLAARLEGLRSEWARVRPHPVTYQIGVAAVTISGSYALLAAEEALRMHGGEDGEAAAPAIRRR